MSLLARLLHAQYNCAHFVCEAWKQETGDDITHALAGFLLPPGQRTAEPVVKTIFKPSHQPQSPCIVLFRRAKATPHVGMFIRGRVFHLTDHGPIRQLLSLASLGYTSVKFYAPR